MGSIFVSQGESTAILDVCNSFNVISLFLYFEDTFWKYFHFVHTQCPFHKKLYGDTFCDGLLENIFIFSRKLCTSWVFIVLHEASYQIETHTRNEIDAVLNPSLCIEGLAKNLSMILCYENWSKYPFQSQTRKNIQTKLFRKNYRKTAPDP